MNKYRRVLGYAVKPLKVWLLRRSEKYNLGLGPIYSFADLLTRYLYARLYQKESYDLASQIVQQYLWVTPLFHLRRLSRKSGLGHIPIRVIFLAGDPLDWGSLESFYKSCMADNDNGFVVHVVNVGMEWQGEYSDCAAHFDKLGIQYHDGINNRARLDLLYPDIIVTCSPYDNLRPSHYGTGDLLRYAKIVYIPYGIDFTDAKGMLSQQTFGNPTQKNSWRIFTRSLQSITNYEKYARKDKASVIPLGLPVLDVYETHSVEPLPTGLKERTRDKFVVVYAPHHTIDGWSTFMQYANCIRDYIQDNNDCFLIFRPHPCLVGTLRYLKIMNDDAFRQFFSGERVYYSEDVNFHSLFRLSHVLVSDASSFLVQYAPTRNPIIYVEKENGWGLDAAMTEYVYESCYIARSECEIVSYIDRLRSGYDSLKANRIQYQERSNIGILSGGSGARIANYLRGQLS